MFTSAKCGAKESDDQSKKNTSLQLCLDKKTNELSLLTSKQLLPRRRKNGAGYETFQTYEATVQRTSLIGRYFCLNTTQNVVNLGLEFFGLILVRGRNWAGP